MTNRTSLLSKIWLTLSVIAAAVFSTFRVYLLDNAYDAANGFYTDEKLHNIFGYTLGSIVILCVVIAYIYIKEENRSFLPPARGLVKGTSLICSITLCGFIIYTFAKAVIPSFAPVNMGDVAMAALSAIAMLYFFTLDKKSDSRSVLAIASSLVLLAIVLILYFDRTVSYVNHSVILAFAACIFSALTFAAEANFALGRSVYRRYLAYAPGAIALAFATALPNLIYFIKNRLTNTLDIYFDIIILVFGIYHLSRLAEIAFYKEEK